MNLQARVVNILTRPAAEWPIIASEPTDVASLYTLGTAYSVAPDKVEKFLAANWPVVSKLMTDHGPWEGFNVTRQEAIRVQTSAHTLSLILKPDFQQLRYSAWVDHAIDRRFQQGCQGKREEISKLANKDRSTTLYMDAFAKAGHVAMLYWNFGSNDNNDYMIEALSDSSGTDENLETYRFDSSYVGVRRDDWTQDCWPNCAHTSPSVVVVP